MSASERQASSTVVREVDPLLKDLNEKKQSFRQNVVSLAAELKEVRGRLVTQEQCIAKETLNRKEAETEAKMMEEEISRLQKSLDERNIQLQASSSAGELNVNELDASALSAQSAQMHCSRLVNELEEKSWSLKEHEIHVNKLEEQLDLLQKDLLARELSQRQLKDEVLRIEHEIMQAVAKSGSNKDCELMKILDEVSPRNFDNINKLLGVKDEEIAKLRDDVRIMSAHWKLKTKEMESQLEKHRRADQDLKKRVLKLEFYLQEARGQTRKLQRTGERRDKALKELRDQLAAKQPGSPPSVEKQNFWETSGFKIVVPMSMLILVIFSKR